MSETAYLVTIGDREFKVRVRRSDDQVFVRVDDTAEIATSLENIRGPLYTLSVDSQRFEFLGRFADNTVDVSLAGHEYRAEVVDEARARLTSMAGARTATHARRELRAPMPGLLVSLLVQPGDAVEPNQPLAVLRAMKMENELSLPRGGTIVTVNADAGQTVEQNQVILVVE